ncbi:MAG TPA: hypothetical protein VJ946_03370, partial [Bacteroidales bacterium]|nr:hypothetical protein [Bacteroidales bacterium]
MKPEMTEKEIHSLLEAEAKAVAGIPVTGEFEKAIELLYHHVHEKKGKLITSGMGKAGQIAV